LDGDPEPSGSAPPERKRLLRTITEGKRFEGYVEQQTRDMHACALCQRILYRKTPMKQIGARWVCIDCLKSLKEALDSLEQWEQMALLHDKLEQDVHGALRR
jgi:hypothetical protein